MSSFAVTPPRQVLNELNGGDGLNGGGVEEESPGLQFELSPDNKKPDNKKVSLEARGESSPSSLNKVYNDTIINGLNAALKSDSVKGGSNCVEENNGVKEGLKCLGAELAGNEYDELIEEIARKIKILVKPEHMRNVLSRIEERVYDNCEDRQPTVSYMQSWIIGNRRTKKIEYLNSLFNDVEGEFPAQEKRLSPVEENQSNGEGENFTIEKFGLDVGFPAAENAGYTGF